MLSMSKILAGIATAGFVGFATLSLAQAGIEDKRPHSHGQVGGTMMEECKAMMSARQQTTSELESAQSTLDALLEEMNAAEGGEKMDAMMEVVAALVAQRRSMMSKVMAIEPRMMRHMMRHMKVSMEEGADGRMECPMMKALGAEEKKQSSQ